MRSTFHRRFDSNSPHSGINHKVTVRRGDTGQARAVLKLGTVLCRVGHLAGFDGDNTRTAVSSAAAGFDRDPVRGGKIKQVLGIFVPATFFPGSGECHFAGHNGWAAGNC